MKLIVTADDVGLDRGMTEGAIRAHVSGIVTACSIVANGIDFDDAVARLRDVPALEVGVHLALVEERALTTGRPMPKNYVRYVLRPGHPEAELRAQIEKVLATGLRVTHLNGHQHLHMLPRVFAIVERLAKEYGIGYIRRVGDRGGRAGLARRASIAVLNRLGRGNTIGVMEAGHLTAPRIVDLLDHVRGITELVTHPGVGVTRYPHWRYAWDEETRALCDPRVRDEIVTRGIELVAPSHV
ncbi:MAG TPA: ChbG/HpnK family deacetylase [Thermoanaerobaculia bacterium]|nr:ChbG/HpnK family deacetylase [Thermoanaerobaculia bacterium]